MELSLGDIISRDVDRCGLLNCFDPYKLYYSELHRNKNAHELFNYISKYVLNDGFMITNWHELSENPAAIHLLEAHLDKVKWTYLSINPAAIHLLKSNFDKIDWHMLSSNPAAVHILAANLDKVVWGQLSRNPAAVHILATNLDKVDWYALSSNPAIFG